MKYNKSKNLYKNNKCFLKRYIFSCLAIKNNRSNKLLLDCDDSISYFSLKGQTFQAKITNFDNVRDFNICFFYHKKISKFSARLLNIPFNKASDLSLKTWLPSDLIVYTIVDEFDIDGKLLVTIYKNKGLYDIGDISINEQIILKMNIDGTSNNLDPLFSIDL